MRPLDGIAGELRWLKPKHRRSEYELRAGDELVATLTWSRGARATGRTASAAYRFAQRGWFRPQVLIYSGDDATAQPGEAPVATIARRTGLLTFPDGRTCTWKKPKHWTNDRIWATAAGDEILRCTPHRTATTVSIATPSAGADLSLLLLLGQYLLLLDQQDTLLANTAAATVVSTG